jgi:hypothetical protein
MDCPKCENIRRMKIPVASVILQSAKPTRAYVLSIFGKFMDSWSGALVRGEGEL